MGSTPSTPAALIRAWSLSACCIQSQQCILAKAPPRTEIPVRFLGSPAQIVPITFPWFFPCNLVSYSLAPIES